MTTYIPRNQVGKGRKKKEERVAIDLSFSIPGYTNDTLYRPFILTLNDLQQNRDVFVGPNTPFTKVFLSKILNIF